MEQKRILPTISIAGTTFIIDVQKEELRQQDQAENIISFSEMSYDRAGYNFDYNTELKNIPVSFVNGYESIHLPNLTELDPIGMAQRFGLTQAEVTGKIDVDIIVDQQQLALREGGQLPIIEIAGHPFYVDLAMDALRPKDDFTTTGIRFSEIDDYYVDQCQSYRFPYNPKTHSFQEPDYDTIMAIPKELIVIEIPPSQQLDPVAFARIHGFDKDRILRENPVQMQMKAKEIHWDDTPIKQIIARNLKRDMGKVETNQNEKPQRKRGRRL